MSASAKRETVGKLRRLIAELSRETGAGRDREVARGLALLYAALEELVGAPARGDSTDEMPATD